MVGKTILVVDDEADIRETIKTVLTKEGYKVITAVSADDALKKYSTTKPALILMDIMMPGTPVKDVVPKLKGAKVAYLSVVRTSEAGKDLIKKLKPLDYIEKPIETPIFKRKIKKILGA